MNKAVFLDRDGTINVDKHYLYRIEDFEFLHGVIEGLKLLQDAGYLLIIVTNQSGIGRGYYTEKEYQRLMTWLINELWKKGVKISASYFCPHLPNAQDKRYKINCDCRKPQLGLFQRAIVEHNVDLSHSWAIGDRLRDCIICEKTACHGFLVGHTEGEFKIRAVRAGKFARIQYAESLYEASKIIAGGEK